MTRRVLDDIRKRDARDFRPLAPRRCGRRTTPLRSTRPRWTSSRPSRPRCGSSLNAARRLRHANRLAPARIPAPLGSLTIPARTGGLFDQAFAIQLSSSGPAGTPKGGDPSRNVDRHRTRRSVDATQTRRRARQGTSGDHMADTAAASLNPTRDDFAALLDESYRRERSSSKVPSSRAPSSPSKRTWPSSTSV